MTDDEDDAVRAAPDRRDDGQQATPASDADPEFGFPGGCGEPSRLDDHPGSQARTGGGVRSADHG